MSMEQQMENPTTNQVGKQKKKRNVLKEILSYAIIIALAFFLAQFWKEYISTKVEVISGSMKDTLQIDDRLIASKLPYIFGEPQRGDIVVFYFQCINSRCGNIFGLQCGNCFTRPARQLSHIVQ